MSTRQIQLLLSFLGYDPGPCDGLDGPQTREAVTAFQRGFGGLTTDGQSGEATQKALRHAVAYGMPEKKQPDTGTFWDGIKYFTREEFRCPCGKWCNGFPVEPSEKLVREAQDLRVFLGKPVIIVPPDGHSGGSGVRCQRYNDSLGGSVPNSRHVQGKAIDFSCPGVADSAIEAYLSRRKASGNIRYWYRISPGSFHMDVD